MVTSAMLARQIIPLDPLPTTLTPLLRYSCKLFVALAKVKSFAIKQIRTLCAKYRGWGLPLRHIGNSWSQPFSFLAITDSQLTRFQQVAASSRLFALFCDLPSFVFNRLQPLFRKHRGWGISRRGQGSRPADLQTFVLSDLQTLPSPLFAIMQSSGGIRL
jgi:hypothetical protein